jgi:hypothetical protein
MTDEIVYENPSRLFLFTEAGPNTKLYVEDDYHSMDEYDYTVTLRKKLKPIPGHYLRRGAALNNSEDCCVYYWSKNDIEQYGGDLATFYRDYRRVKLTEYDETSDDLAV